MPHLLWSVVCVFYCKIKAQIDTMFSCWLYKFAVTLVALTFTHTVYHTTACP